MNTTQIRQAAEAELWPSQQSFASAKHNNKITSLTDNNLFNLCKTYGERTRFWRQKFIGLLPAVFKRKLYEKKGFESIFVFAYKLAGLSKEQVNLALNLEIKFEKTPVLKELLVSGEVSINKLARVASIANSENEIFLAEKVRILSKSAVETLVRDEKLNRADQSISQNKNGLQEPLFGGGSLPGQSQGGVPNACISELNLSPEVHAKLLQLQQKGFDLNQLLNEFLQKREQEIAEKKAKISDQILQKESNLQKQNKTPSHHVPQAAKKILREEHGTKCAVNGCNKLAEHIHHGLPFSIGKSHNPNLLIPLCKSHHELAHSVDISYHQIRNR